MPAFGGHLLFNSYLHLYFKLMKEITTLIQNIALGKVDLKFETLTEIPNATSWFKKSDYKISGLLYFHDSYLQFSDFKGRISRTFDYEEISEIKSQKGIELGGVIVQPFGLYQSLIVEFFLQDGASYSANIMTEIYLTEEDLKIQKSPAPSLEKTLATIYKDYKKIDQKRPDFPEYDF